MNGTYRVVYPLSVLWYGAAAGWSAQVDVLSDDRKLGHRVRLSRYLELGWFDTFWGAA